MRLSPTEYKFIWNAINEKVEAARAAWKECNDEDVLYIYENKYVDAQRALDNFEEAYLGSDF